MVLENTMKRAAYIIAGAFLVWFLGVLLFIPFNRWYTLNFIKGDDDVGVHLGVMVFVVWPILLVVGGGIGNRVWARRKNKKKFLDGLGH